MEELAELKRQLMEARPDGWEDLPDIPLYMDQVVSYLSRQMACFGEGEGLTPAMINNYMNDAADHLDADTSDHDLPKLVLELAMRSYANMLACHQALAILAQRTGHEDLLTKKR